MKRKIILSWILAVCMLAPTFLLAGCKEEEQPLLKIEVKDDRIENGTVTIDKSEIYIVDEAVNITMKPDDGYMPYGIYFYDADGNVQTATYYMADPKLDGFTDNGDGTYTTGFQIGKYYSLYATSGSSHSGQKKELTVAYIEADFVSLEAPSITVEKKQEHSEISVFPPRGEKGTNVKIVIGCEPGYEVTYCAHNGKEFPVDEPLATYADAQYNYVSFSFYLGDEDEVVTYEVQPIP